MDPPEGYREGLPGYYLEISGGLSGPATLTFTHPYGEAALAESGLSLHEVWIGHAEDDVTWVLLEPSVDTSAGTLTVTVESFSPLSFLREWFDSLFGDGSPDTAELMDHFGVTGDVSQVDAILDSRWGELSLRELAEQHHAHHEAHDQWASSLGSDAQLLKSAARTLVDTAALIYGASGLVLLLSDLANEEPVDVFGATITAAELSLAFSGEDAIGVFSALSIGALGGAFDLYELAQNLTAVIEAGDACFLGEQAYAYLWWSGEVDWSNWTTNEPWSQSAHDQIWADHTDTDAGYLLPFNAICQSPAHAELASRSVIEEAQRFAWDEFYAHNERLVEHDNVAAELQWYAQNQGPTSVTVSAEHEWVNPVGWVTWAAEDPDTDEILHYTLMLDGVAVLTTDDASAWLSLVWGTSYLLSVQVEDMVGHQAWSSEVAVSVLDELTATGDLDGDGVSVADGDCDDDDSWCFPWTPMKSTTTGTTPTATTLTNTTPTTTAPTPTLGAAPTAATTSQRSTWAPPKSVIGPTTTVIG